MKAREKFDIIGSPLAGEVTLIEASAGTGKTYTISGLVLRLILEKQLAIEDILVTTYTELATAELRDRIRHLLFQALEAFQTGESNDELIQPLMQRYQADGEARRRIYLALQTFDDAPIYTIHGFSQRMLKDRAFESGAFFDAVLITDQSDILREIVDDFWRRHFYSGNQIVTIFAMKNGLTPEKFLRHIGELTNNPALLVIPPLEEDIEILKDKFAAIWVKLQDCWSRSADEIRTIFQKNGWAKFLHGNSAKMAAGLAALSDCLSNPAGAQEKLICFETFAFSRIERNVRAGWPVPRHELFTLCDELLQAEQKLCVSLQAEFFAWARVEMKRRKVKRNVLSFDDLLTRLDEALSGDSGSALARLIRERFKAALIDEFQDTDPVQYSIFQKIHGGTEMPIFFIGDPKQAIYGFRGADVFTYITAAATAPHQFTLGRNWRSATELLQAINSLFTLSERPFILDGIPFEPAQASGECDERLLTVNGVNEPPLKLWLAIEEELIKNKDADRWLPTAVAAEIARLLNGNAKIGENKVRPEDIAVLVSENAEARIVQDALTGLNIPSVLYSAANVFKSREAIDLGYILAAVSEPGNEKLVKAALTTDTLGLTGDELDAMVRNDRAWEATLIQFQRYHQLWRERGFIQMLRTLFLERAVRARLLRYPAGERRLTNLLHLAELMHSMFLERRLGMTGALKRLSEQIQSPDPTRSEDYEQRLESDEKAVRIVTVHKSKGLEYEIVFCPFCWSDAERAPDRSVIFHENGKLTLDLAKSDAHERAQRRELLAEKMRLLYVALTRAKHRCYVVWGNFRGGRMSAPAYLFGVPKSRDALEELEKHSKTVTGAQIRSEVQRSLGREKTIEIVDLPKINTPERSYQPGRTEAVELRPRRLDRTIDRTMGITSFTGLIRGHDIAPESPDYDNIETAQDDESPSETTAPPLGIFAFPRGTRPGTCLHQIFQELDFSNLDNMPSVVSRNLRAFSIPDFDEVVCETVRKTVSVPLEIASPEFTLSRIAAAAKLQELEFYFPIGAVTSHRLALAFSKLQPLNGAIPSTIDQLHFQPMSGFMKGFIDLVFEYEERFYLLDWKSNWLGPDLSAYAPAAIETEMALRFYTLQLSIYSVALHRFLRSRKPDYQYEKHFGGAYYMFLRGIEPARPEFGVHRVKLPADFVDTLSTMLGDDQ